MKISLHDNNLHLRFAPLTLTRPVGNLRIGILTNDERWKLLMPDAEIYFETEGYLTGKFRTDNAPDITVNAAVIPDRALAAVISDLKSGEALVYNGNWIAQKGKTITQTTIYQEELIVLEYRWDLFMKNGPVLKADFELLTKGRVSAILSPSNTVIGDPFLIFLEEGATVEAAILNTKEGPIYLGRSSEIMEGAMVRGPLALCAYAGLKLGTKVYGPTTLGPHCKAGGELNNVVFQAYSNKGHDGFLGNSVIGEWCNMGADTNCSNLKNNYSEVSTYSYETKQPEKTDVQFMGLVMGDHSKCGINTMFNTASVVGVSANIYGAGFPEKMVNSFTWGGPEGMVPFRLDKAVEVAKAMMSRRKVEFTEGDMVIFKKLAESDL